ncbi:unnamed protein product [Rotaria socialis]|uniref:G-protein coupled receptors family 1 profile domain-containing protein n=1 Tax=Rotaria socialis TaxID=392032 RepID=A0A820CEJ2_9BILA|nr:unnamed protein product [Rotaria socialis]CAF3342110.1 unnamed protein product [Rotaria socialis]CAF3601082.1 unnamed protein product [Rotaria socialis]CAF4205977.1 unnamed protein product [Rotaria socialis]CAF4551811.1 unnamed protein product [Rotaria socialis]
MSTVAMTLNLSSLIGSVLIAIVCVFMLSVLLRSIIIKPDVVLILTANNYLSIFAFEILSVSNNMDVYRAQHKLYVAEETLICRIKGYSIYSLTAIIFNSFALHAVFRFCRVVYPSHIWLQYRITYAVIIPMLWVISFLLLLPVHIWHDVELIPTENICLFDVDDARAYRWSTIIIYYLPMIFIGIIYFKVVRYMHRSVLTTSVRSKLDLIVARRIVRAVRVLILVSAPTVVMEVMLPSTDTLKPLFYRILNATLVMIMVALSLMLVYVTPQLKQILARFAKRNRVSSVYLK